MGRKSDYSYKKEMRQVVLERLTFQKCSAVAMVSPVTVYARA